AVDEQSEEGTRKRSLRAVRSNAGLATARECEPGSERKLRVSKHILDLHINYPLAERAGLLADKLDDCSRRYPLQRTPPLLPRSLPRGHSDGHGPRRDPGREGAGAC